jgi:hypothetical protein
MFSSLELEQREEQQPFISLPAGHHVVLLEKDAGIRVKPCGGGMAASVQNWFPFSLNPPSNR